MRIAFVILLLLLQGTPARDDGQWTMPAKNNAATRYSGLSQITPANARRLHPVWNFSTGVLGGHEGQPLVVGSTMYVVTPFPNVLYAFDLTREGYPLKWKYRPEVNPAAVGIACCDAINRGAVYADGKIIYNLLDGHTVAVDAVTGSEVWKTQIADINQGETTPMAPFVAGNRVIVGPSGGEFGIYGWAKGLDLATGKILWTAHNMGPDSLLLARPGRGRYTADANIGVSTWEGDSWRRGGARERHGHLSQPRGRQESRVAVLLLAAHGVVLHGDQQSLHEFRGDAGDAHPGHPVHRRHDAVFRGARWQHGRVHRLGCGPRPQSLGDQREIPGLERQRRDRR